MFKKQAGLVLETVSSGMLIQKKGIVAKIYHKYESNIQASKASNLPIPFMPKSVDSLNFSLRITIFFSFISALAYNFVSAAVDMPIVRF